jgi:type I restriction enzyme S subunit
MMLSVFRIGELGRVVTGKTPSSKSPELFGDKFPFITPTDMSSDARYIDTQRAISEQGATVHSNQLLPKNAVCYVCIGATIGKLCMTKTRSLTNQQINSVVVDEKKFDPFFVYYLLSTTADSVKARAGGAATPIVNKSSFESVPVEAPSLLTQHKIAAILSVYDDLIENNNRRIAILEEMAELVYKEWFVHFRFPGHDQVKMVDSELGPVPEGWEVVKLGDIAEINAQSIKRGDEPEFINYVNISSVSPGRIDQIEQMSFSEAPGRARRIVQHGDIIWSTVRPNRRSYSVIYDPLPNTIASTGFAVITQKTTPYTYLYYVVTTDDFTDYLVNNATGSAYPAVNASDFEKAEILLPPKPLTDAFHKIVDDIFAQKHILSMKNDTLRQTRDLLLPHLISGELDMSDLDIDIGDVTN